jgi:predicted permease
MPDFRPYVRQHLPALRIHPAREDEIVAELALQLEQAYSDAIAAGSSESEALPLAAAQFGDWRQLAREIQAAERHHPPQPEARSGLFSGLTQDIRYALRFFRRNPAFAAIAAGTLAFGIGGNTAIFTMVDTLALRGLPYPAADRLASIDTYKTQQPEIEPWTSAQDFFDIRDTAKSFSAVAAISPVWNLILTQQSLTAQRPAERLECLYVSASFFPILGVKPALGRTFTAQEDNRASRSAVVMLSHALWQRRFASSPDIVGKSITLDSALYTVIGVLPRDFRYEGEPVSAAAVGIDAWLPLSSNPLIATPRGVRFLRALGRLKPGVSILHARDEIRSIGQGLSEQYPDANRGFTLGAQPLAVQVTGRLRTSMLLLLGTVGFVLLMACANVANLLLARAATRQKEISVRIALGASRFRLLRQLLVEGLVLALAGGAVGLLFARPALAFLASTAPQSLSRLRDTQLDPRALLFTAAAVLVSAILAGLPPAWRTMRAQAAEGLQQTGRGLTAGHHRLRSALVVVEVAAALVLLAGAGLLIHSFQRLLDVDPGFNPRNLVTISTQTPPNAPTAAQRTAIFHLIRERLASVPGVQSVAAVSRLPLMGSNLGSSLFVEGKSVPGESAQDVEYRVATPDYFSTMGIPLLRGRLFDDHDLASSAVINQTMAQQFWRGENPIGRRIKLGPNPEKQPWITVIGVAGNIRHFALDAEPRPEVYRPYAASPLFAPILAVRTTRDPAPLLGELAAQVRSIDAAVPAYDVYLMQNLVDRSTAQRRFVMSLLTGFAMAALLLSGLGIYGMVSQSVAQRTREIGLRMALGASPFEALIMVFRDGMRLAVIGIAAGSLAAAGLTQLMRKLLFEVRPLDPAAFGLAALTLAAFAALACYFPARRATRVDPLVALRQE